MAETGPPPPPPPPDIGIPPLAEEALILVLDSIFPGLGELVVAVIWVIEQIVNFLTDAFSGVPHEAKTIGTAGQLIHAKDAILQYFGIQMMAGAANGRVLSESGAVTFEEQLSHATGGLISWANYQPLGSYWPSNFTVNKATGKADYLLKPVPPPKGAPYNQDVRPFVAAWPPMTPQDYQARYGKPPPDLIDAGLFLQSGRTPKFNTKEIRQSIRQKDFDQAVKIWLTEYQKWVDDGRPGIIPAPPRPDKGKGNIIFDPEMIAIVDRVRLCICEIDTAFTPLANALTPLLQLLDAAALVEIENCLCGNLTRIAAGIENIGPSNLAADLTRIAAALEQANKDADIPQALIDDMAIDLGLTPEQLQLYSGALHVRIRGKAATAEVAKATEFVGAFKKYAETWAPKVIKAFPGFMLEVLKESLSVFLTGNADITSAHGKEAIGVGKALFNAIDAAAGTPGTDALDFVLEHVKKLKDIRPGESADTAGTTLSRAWMMGESAHLLAMIAGIVGYPQSRIFEGMAALVAEASGFHEITRTIHGAWYQAAFARPTLAQANEQFRTNYPPGRYAGDLFARRKIEQTKLEELFGWDGTPRDLVPAYVEAAFRPLSPFILGRLADDTGFDETKTRDALADMGFRDSGIDLAIEGFRKLSLKSHRAGAVGAVVATFEKGLMDDAHFDQMLTDLEIDADAKTLIKTQALERRLVGLTEDFKKAWDDRLIGGTITPADYRVALAGLGYVAPILDALVGIGQARTEVAVAKEEHKQQEATIRKTQTELTLAAMTSFKKGDLNALELAAGLTAIGLAPAVVAGYVALAEARGVTKPKSTKPKPASTPTSPKPTA